MGHCADYVLQKRPGVLRVFIYSDLESRKYRIEHIYHESLDIALAQIEKTDKKRVAYYQYYSGQKFGDTQNYDLCLNSAAIGIDECVRIIHELYSKKKNELQLG